MVSYRIRQQVLRRDGWRCVRCGCPGRLEVHHLVPVHAGGSNDLSNLETLCRDCHFAEYRKTGPLRAELEAFAREPL